jgi:phospholipid/cholesterol/gamma-HCH transport system ATP-binding protein
VERGKVFIVMGGSGCGKSSVLRVMIGLLAPLRGEVVFGGASLWSADEAERERLTRRFGVLYQSGALWSSMTLTENIGLPLGEFTDLTGAQIREVRLARPGWRASRISIPADQRGMQKRARLARAMALDSRHPCLDEPSAGLDPISSRLLDDPILEPARQPGCTVVVVTHELASIFAIGDDSVFSTRHAHHDRPGNPKTLPPSATDPKVAFLTRGQGVRLRGEGEDDMARWLSARTRPDRGLRAGGIAPRVGPSSLGGASGSSAGDVRDGFDDNRWPPAVGRR